MLAACATSSTPATWTPTRIARGMGGLVSMIRRSPAGRPLRRLADRVHFASSRQNGAAAFMDRSFLDDESAPFQRKAKGFVSRGLLRTTPDDQRTGRIQELHQPIKRDLQGFERAPPPVNQCYVVLAGRMAAICRGCRASIAAAMQFQHQVDGPGPRHPDSVLLGAA